MLVGSLLVAVALSIQTIDDQPRSKMGFACLKQQIHEKYGY
jgi:hypothetical protein